MEGEGRRRHRALRFPSNMRYSLLHKIQIYANEIVLFFQSLSLSTAYLPSLDIHTLLHFEQEMNIIVQATAMAYIVSGENVVMREYSIKFILILKMEKNKQIYCIGILYLQTFLEGHYGIVIYSNVNTKSLMLFILFKVRRLAQENRYLCHLLNNVFFIFSHFNKLV